MKKHIPTVVGVLLGLLFIMSGVVVLFNLAPMPKLTEGSPPALFMGAFGPTGYMAFVKVFEILGGILLVIPRTRNLGLLIIGPILVNILAYHTFIMKGEGLFNPMLLVIVALALYLLWVGRKAFAGLMG
jgi:putative oxidoreductase